MICGSSRRRSSARCRGGGSRDCDAIRIANDTNYGLGAGQRARSGNIAYRAGRDIQAGRVWVNQYQITQLTRARWLQGVRYWPREPPDDVVSLPAHQEPAVSYSENATARSKVRF